MFAAPLLPRLFGNSIPGHTTRAPSVGFELATNGVQLLVIANLDIMIRGIAAAAGDSDQAAGPPERSSFILE